MMDLAQVAAQAVETGKSGISVFFDAGLIGLILTNSGLLIKALFDRRNVKEALSIAAKAAKTEAGKARPCEAHADRLERLESSIIPQRLATLEANYVTTVKTLDDMRRENREDHGKIFDAISDLRK